jgi:ABC-type antimicrobial peptide transport system permease subunit
MPTRQFANRSLGITAILCVAALPLVYVVSVAAIYMIPPRPDEIMSGRYVDRDSFNFYSPTVAEYESEMLATALVVSVLVAIAYTLLAGLAWGTAFAATRLMIPPDASVQQRFGGPPPRP